MTLDLFQKEDQHNNGPVTVLGKTFANDEERRAYFREELRKKLPELKEIEGFPIGEDEDIINLSDPPFYTACPNPWINDFIAEWEEEKKQLEKEGKRVPDFEVTEPYNLPINEQKNNQFYKAHSYHTKVPHEVIINYYLYYTQPGDIVLDNFAGTGMAATAVNEISFPTSQLKEKFNNRWLKDFNKLPIWGIRKGIFTDLSPIASFINYNYNNDIDANKFKYIAEKIYDELVSDLGYLYLTKHDNFNAEINYVIWSEHQICDACNHDFLFWDAAVDFENKKQKNTYNCPNCTIEITKSKSKKFFITEYDMLLNENYKTCKYSPVIINYTYQGKRFEKKVSKYDSELLDKIDKLPINKGVPISKLKKGDKTSDPFRLGVEYLHQFYTKRNLIILAKFLELIENYPCDGRMKNYLKIWFTSCQSRLHRMNRYAVNHGRHVGPMANTLYISATPTEISPFYFIKSKIKDNYLVFKTNNNILNQAASATVLKLKSNSIDYIFTDPPFGANIMYSELNFLWEAWLKVFTNNKEEAISNKTQNKGTFEYQNLITKSFEEYYRVLKPGKWMTVEFSNTSATIWNSIQYALQKAGFIVSLVTDLNKGRGGLHGIVGDVAVNQDLAISCYKPSSEFDTKFQQSQHSAMGVWDFVEEHLSHLPIHLVKDNATTAIIERSAKILFDRLIAFYVQKGLPVPIDAGVFQKGLRERFIERDGMFFTNEQVQEYERKKAEVPEFIQMSLFVGSEQDAVYWLRQLLEKERRTESDLHPLWMREVAGNMRKGDTLPEMRQILEENFLKDETGKWYVPDAENEADLEKLRNKRLLKIFEDYKAEAAKPKGKLKEVRVEALRVGFKQCYQDKDFKTIVNVGDHIPNNLLMEDEVLLQFYDIASAKI